MPGSIPGDGTMLGLNFESWSVVVMKLGKVGSSPAVSLVEMMEEEGGSSPSHYALVAETD